MIVSLLRADTSLVSAWLARWHYW